MPGVCFYFQVHQPWRLRHYSVFDVGGLLDYFDDDLNREVMQKVARKCYLPANQTLLKMIERYQGRFRCSFSLSGVALEQMLMYAPEVIDSFRALVDTGCVEILGETYYHSLASLGDELEFRVQIAEHGRLIHELFGVTPKVFRNTELIYNNRIGEIASELGFQGILAEGADDVLGWRSPSFGYAHPNCDITLLLKHYRLSDDIAFRFSNRGWPEWPLTAEKFANWTHQISGNGEVLNLFMDYETLGEHQWEETGIFQFMEVMPREVLRHPDWEFWTPSEALQKTSVRPQLSFPRTVSWADSERDVTAWLGNDMQQDAFKEIYGLRDAVYAMNNPEATHLWRRLQTSDHLYYMCTKWFADGDVHAYFSPYESPYEAYINYKNVLEDLREALNRPRYAMTQRS